MPAYKDEKQNTWYCQFYYEDWQGNKKKKQKRGFKTKKEALEWERNYKLSANANMDMTMGAFIEIYFRDKAGELKERSAKNKRYMIEAHVLPYFENKPMNSITPSDIIQWQNEIRAKGFSQTYLRMIQNQITALFTHASNIYNLANNPCKRVKRMGKADADKLEFWTKEEYDRFISGIEVGSRYYVIFEILFWTGCRENKRYMIEAHVLPYFENKPMNSITPSDIIQWQNEIRAKGFSQTYLRMIQNQITALFTHASNIYNLANNPCKRVKRMGKADADKLEFWTKEEYDRFISGIEVGSRYYVIFEILFWTGCREGEMLALTKSDIDFTENRISISKTYYRTERKDVITTPKTEQSVRVIDIPQFLTQEIRDYVDKLYELPDDERIFPIVAEAVQHKLKHNCEKTGVKKIRVHDIRHSHVAYLINQGVQPLIIKERLGHRDIKITLNTYGHLYPNQQRQVADMLNQQRTEKVPTAATVRT